MKQSITLLEDSSSNNSTDLITDETSTPRTPTWTTCFKRLRITSVLLAALPRYMQPRGLRRKQRRIPSSYLDALRGYAALIVVNYHVWQHEEHTWLMQLPFIRLLIAGRGMVDVFFVISGYVLSYRLLILMRKEDGHLLDALASSTFRRYFRLYCSTGAATFIAMIVVWLGWIEVTDGIEVTGRKETFLAQIWDWWRDLANLSNPIAPVEGYWHLGDLNSRYLNQLWTIPVEFRGSMVVFLFCTMACKLSTRYRMILTWILAIACYYWQVVYAALFLLGMWIADVSLGRHPERLNPVQLPQQEQKPEARSTSKPADYCSDWVCDHVSYRYLLLQPSRGPRPTRPLALATPQQSHSRLGHRTGTSLLSRNRRVPASLCLRVISSPAKATDVGFLAISRGLIFRYLHYA